MCPGPPTTASMSAGEEAIAAQVEIIMITIMNHDHDGDIDDGDSDDNDDVGEDNDDDGEGNDNDARVSIPYIYQWSVCDKIPVPFPIYRGH